MSRSFTYGTYCELKAAGEVFSFCFEVYRNGELYTTAGTTGLPIKRLRFTGNLSSGHFDAYVPYGTQPASSDIVNANESNDNLAPSMSSVDLNGKTSKKRRARYTNLTASRKKKIARTNRSSRQAAADRVYQQTYQQAHPETNRRTSATYRQAHPETNRRTSATYRQAHRETVRESRATYRHSHPETNRRTTANYQKAHPETNRRTSATNRQAHPAKHRESQARYRSRPWEKKLLSAMAYDPSIAYDTDKTLALGLMNQKCKWCNALKWRDESLGMCCSDGKLQLEQFKRLPEPLYGLILGSHPEQHHFMTRLRKYNACFQMTSFGANQITYGGFMPTFKVQGQVYHLVGSVLPQPEENAQFLQIYFVGEDERELELRCALNPDVNPNLVKQLQHMLHEINEHVRNLKTAMDKISSTDTTFHVVIHADRKPASAHSGRYNAPTANEVGLVIVGQQFTKRDIVLQSHDSQLQRISEIHRSYDALQYPLLFPYGDDGYSIDIPQLDPFTKVPLKKTVSAVSFYAFRIMIREGEDNHLFYFGPLFSQFLVDMYAKVETERLNFIRHNQSKLRADTYIHLLDAVGKIDVDARELGQAIVLPSSFTGGPRYMHERTQDALTYVRHYGRPDLFITFTCNPQWEDITAALLSNQKTFDRHDIIARVFHLKVKKLMTLLTKGCIFGQVRCFMYSVEWQKRGLPHVHILLWLENRIEANNIDNVICAEIPNLQEDPELHQIVTKHMIHGPCGVHNCKFPCMKNGTCTKRFPRPLTADTQTGHDGYPLYRRRSALEGGFTVHINGKKVDNSWVVAYNPVLSRAFNAHINVEYCNSVKAIKYICKYVNKGSDQAAFALENDKDEVKAYESGRYISTSEAVWRILTFPIHERFPTVVHLAVHLENGQRVYFTANNIQERLSTPPRSTLLAFFELCQTDEFAKTLLYPEVPIYFRWDNKKFIRRKRGIAVDGWSGVKKDSALGRVYTIHPNNTECYHLRLLLHHIRGPTSFESLKTIDGIIHRTFQSACNALGLLEDDKHWQSTLEEAALCDSPTKMRELFTIMLSFCQLTDPLALWEKFRDHLSEDIHHELQMQMLTADDSLMVKAQDKCLMLLQDALLSLGGQHLTNYGLPKPHHFTYDSTNIEYVRETNYDKTALLETVFSNERSLTNEQLAVYRQILQSVNEQIGQIFFLDAPGGTGKTFLINLLLAKVRSEHGIALAVASSGIAATLLQGGKTAHAAFKLPLNLNNIETPCCNITKQSNLGEVLKLTKLIVWDECTMAHKGGFEALNRTLQDIRSNKQLMGGLTVLLAGDFRQTLPVISRGTRADEVKACLKSSYLWPSISTLNLKTNMRVHLNNDRSASHFADLLLQIGNGQYAECDGKIKLRDDLCIAVPTLKDLINHIYPEIENIRNKPLGWLPERAILTPKNDQATVINNLLLSSFQAHSIVYKSIDSVIETDAAVHYPVEFLNSINPPGLPAHELHLKVGAPILLLRNLKPPKLCNGTRLQITALHKNLIEATIMIGCGQGESVLIPRIPLIPSDYPFEFKRLQFPVKVCFAITINKSQGQSLKLVGIDLREKCFSHGQLYVACSRVSSSNSLFIIAPDLTTTNVVYKEVL